jgi:electron transfer flavoprotein beta subunit
MGCDDAYLLSAREFGGSDTCATAIIISTALKKIGYDIVITGRQAIDGDTAQVGPQIAENLGIPQVSYTEAFEVNGDTVTVKRQYEDRHHILEVKLPCLLTALQELAEPRYMHAGGIIDAYEKEITVLGFDDLKDDLNPDFIGLNGSPTKVVTSFGKMAKGAGTKLEVTPDEAVAAIIAKMEERHII